MSGFQWDRRRRRWGCGLFRLSWRGRSRYRRRLRFSCLRARWRDVCRSSRRTRFDRRRTRGGGSRLCRLGPRRWTRGNRLGWAGRRRNLSWGPRWRRCNGCSARGRRRRGLRGLRNRLRCSVIGRGRLASEQTAQELNAHRRPSGSHTVSTDRQRTLMRERGRVGRPLARLWTHGLPAPAARGTVARLCAQGAAPAKHRGTAGWLRASAPSQPPLSPCAADLSTAGRSSRRPPVYRRSFLAAQQRRIRVQLARHQRQQPSGRIAARQERPCPSQQLGRLSRPLGQSIERPQR